MNEHLISVIIPVYNTAEYLPRCLDSILNNTYRELEVICVNDGSRDNSLEVLNGYTAKDSRVKVIDQENAGVSVARNRGLDEANGEYIAFVDSDDWVHGQYFEIMLCCALRHDADLTVCNAHYVSEYSKDLPLRFSSDPSKTQTAAQMISGELPIWGKLYRAGFMGEVRFRPGIRLGEDILFNLEMLLLHWDPRLVQCGHTLYYHYSRPDSAVHTESNAKLEPLIDWYFSNLNRAPSREIRAICLE